MPAAQYLDFRSLPTSSLYRDYLYDYEKLGDFYSGNPDDSTAWTQAAATRDERSYPHREVERALRPWNEELGADQAVATNLEALGNGALVVISGQQAGLFGGPLYSLYKAMTAVAVAKRASGWLNRDVVPLFWVAGDDHDFEEIRHVEGLDRDHQLRRFSIQDSTPLGSAGSRAPVGSRRLDIQISGVIDSLRESLPETEFTSEMLQELGDAYAEGSRLSDAFARWMLRITRGTGLIMVDPTLAPLKQIGASLFADELQGTGTSNGIVAKTSQQLRDRGYHAQVVVTPDRLNLFYANPDRYALVADESSDFHLLDADRTRLDATTVLKEHPERFSPNVLMRPLYQDTLFPTIAYVAGPSELAYFAQIRGVYEHFGIPMPLVVPRASLTVVERAQSRFIERYNVDLTRLTANDESLLNELVRRQSDTDFEGSWTKLRVCIEESMRQLEEKVGTIDPTLSATARKTKGRLLHQLQELETKTVRAAKKKNQTLKKQFEAARNSLFPGATLQERRLSAFFFVNRYGWHFTRIVQEHIDIEKKGHRLIYL